MSLDRNQQQTLAGGLGAGGVGLLPGQVSLDAARRSGLAAAPVQIAPTPAPPPPAPVTGVGTVDVAGAEGVPTDRRFPIPPNLDPRARLWAFLRLKRGGLGAIGLVGPGIVSPSRSRRP
jgi:hypothetical protein